MPIKWTEEAIRAEAAKYGSKKEFVRGNSGAHSAACRLGILDDLFGITFRWTEEAIRVEAAKYHSKATFQRGNSGAYGAVVRRFPGLLDELFENTRHPMWTEGAIRAEAAKYGSKIEFARGNPGASSAAMKRFPGLLDEAFPTRKPAKTRKWTEGAIRAEAARYGSIKEFARGNASAYETARKRFPGLIDQLFESRRHQWTEDEIRAEAAKYSSKVDFVRGNSRAHSAACRFGILDELFGRVFRWTEEAIRAEASKYGSRAEFMRDSGGAYQATRRHFPGLIDQLFENLRPLPWTEEAIRAEAARYGSKVEFVRGSPGAHNAAYRLGLLDQLFENKTRTWTEEAIRAEAAKYNSKADFRRGYITAYNAACRRFPGMLDELFENQKVPTDADAFYVWRVDGHWFKGLPVYKFGITSARKGAERIRNCARKNGVRATEVHLFETDTAREWERIFHEAFTVVPDLGFADGKTEFRACRESEVKAFVEFIRPAVLPMAA